MKKRGRKRVEEADHRTSFLSSVERTLTVLELLGENRSIGVTELADTLKTSRSTIHRILATLQKKGFVAQDIYTEKYSLGHKIFRLARSVIEVMDMINYVKPYLIELCKKTGENVSFSVVAPGKNNVLVLAEEISDKMIIARPGIFERFPIYACACGKAYLFSLDDRQLKTVLAQIDIHPFTEFTTKSLRSLKKQLVQFRKLGYSINRDEISVGLCAIASPVYNAEDKFGGAISIIGPSFRFTAKNVKFWSKFLLWATAKLSLIFKAKRVV